MIDVLWNTRGYFFWLLVVSAAVFVLEWLSPWRKEQPKLRRELGQDLFFLVFNGHYLGIALASVGAYLGGLAAPAAFDRAAEWNLLRTTPLWVQFPIFFLLKDLLEWCVHNLLHRVPALWAFHKLHHSIHEMDWIGNFRFHWMEVVIYRTLTYLPLVVLGVDGRVVLWVAILATLIGHLNHSNLNLTWGPLRYVLNSPRMHIWHHDAEPPADRRSGVNFGISLSVWDWLFGTAYWPDRDRAPTQQPRRLGFEDEDRYPRSLIGRMLYPLPLPGLRIRAHARQN